MMALLTLVLSLLLSVGSYSSRTGMMGCSAKGAYQCPLNHLGGTRDLADGWGRGSNV